MAAITAGDEDRVKALVEADPSLPARNSHGSTPMMRAVEERQLEMVRSRHRTWSTIRRSRDTSSVGADPAISAISRSSAAAAKT